jgi:hypothetical protein
MDQEVKDARAKLAARFGQTQIGGKGRYLHLISVLWRGRRGSIFWNEQIIVLSHTAMLIELATPFLNLSKNDSVLVNLRIFERV